MNREFQNFYKKGHDGNMRIWSIGVEDHTIVIKHGVVNGSMQIQTESVSEGKAGRTLEEQITSRVASRIGKRLDIGYTKDYNEALSMDATNMLGLRMPMLAKRFDQIKRIDYTRTFWQRKYNGHRCMIANIDGELVAYTRKGKIIPGVKHILDEIEVPEGMTADGELYCHGVKLQTISSWAKKQQKDSQKLQYVVYDMMEDNSYDFRRMLINELYTGKKNIVIADTYRVYDDNEVAKHFVKAKEDGYEGIMLRLDGYGYEDGLKRSNSLIKVKKVNGFGYIDHEYKVIDVVASKDNWGILVCESENGIFRVTAPGTIDKKTEILKNKYDYIGSYILVEFPEFTQDGIPFQPVAIEFVDPDNK